MGIEGQDVLLEVSVASVATSSQKLKQCQAECAHRKTRLDLRNLEILVKICVSWKNLMELLL